MLAPRHSAIATKTLLPQTAHTVREPDFEASSGHCRRNAFCTPDGILPRNVEIRADQRYPPADTTSRSAVGRGARSHAKGSLTQQLTVSNTLATSSSVRYG